MKSSQMKGKGSRPASTPNKLDFRKLSDKDKDTHFSYNMTVLIGCSAEVTTRNGEKYEGIFVAYSSAQEIMLEAAHLITNENDESAISTHYDVLIIPSDKLMAMKFENAALSYATREFQTDLAISSARTTNSSNKELTPWDDGESETVEDLELGEGDRGTNGWAPNEMFKKNAEKYGVVSSYDQQLSGYTTSLDKTDTETFKKHEEQASQIAEEIESSMTASERSSTVTQRNAAENGDDEEEKYSAVVRDLNYSTVNNNNNSINTCDDSRSEKYVPPSRRNQNTQSQTMNPQPIINNSNVQIQPTHNQQQTGGNSRKSNYGGPRNTYTSSTSNNFYQQDTRRYDRRSLPVQSQYGASSGHGDGNSRSGRDGKNSMDRRGPRDDRGKKELMDSRSSFNVSSDSTQNRRSISSGTTNVTQAPPNSINQVTSQSGTPNQQQRISTHSSTYSTTLKGSSVKAEKEKIVPPSSLLPDTDGSKVEKIEKILPSPQILSQATVPKSTEASETLSSECSTEDTNSTVVVSPASPEARSITGSERSDTAKSVDSTDSKPKPFTFNVNAKEFNPNAKTFAPRSPATPPRPPSTPASTPQLMAATQGHPSYHPIMYLAPQFTQNISPVSNQSLSTNLPPQRHLAPHRKSMGVGQRSDLPSSIPVQTAGPLLTQGTLQNSGPHPQFAAFIPHQHGYAQQVRIHAPGIVPMYNSEGADGNQLHMPLHYIHAGTPAGGPVNQPSVNVSGQTSILSGSPHGYTQSGNHGPQQHHLGYHPSFVGVPVVNVSYPHPHGATPLLGHSRYFD